MAEPKTVGVLGGMGPAATVDFFDKLVRATQATIDQEHLRILIDNNPRIPNRNEAIAGRGPSPGPALAAGARGLERAGADFIVIACNTAHAFAPEIEAAVRVPLLSMIEETVAATLALGAKRVGLLAGDGCLRARLYQNAFAAVGVEALTHDAEQQARMMAVIYRIKAGDVGAGVREGVRALADALIARGADAVIAACTEAPLVLEADALNAPLLSSTDILVARTLAYARGD